MHARRANQEPAVDHLVEVWTSLATACDGIGPSKWDLPTDRTGWSVRDQISVLIGDERALLGETAPDPVGWRPEEGDPPLAAGEPAVELRRRLPGNEVLAEFISVTGRRIHELRTALPERFDELVWSPGGEIPYRDLLADRVVECWAHEQDVRRALGRPGGRNGTGELTALARCERTMPYVVGRRVAPPDGTTVRFVVTGVLGRQMTVAVDGRRATALAGRGPERPTTSLIFDQETFWRLASGRVPGSQALASGQARVEGDLALGHRVLDSMAFVA